MTGTRATHPRYTRLQKARTRRGSAVNLVQTLQGLACRIQVSSSSKKRALIFSSSVIAYSRYQAVPVPWEEDGFADVGEAEHGHDQALCAEPPAGVRRHAVPEGL